jgi:hypothetical protein
MPFLHGAGGDTRPTVLRMSAHAPDPGGPIRPRSGTEQGHNGGRL